MERHEKRAGMALLGRPYHDRRAARNFERVYDLPERVIPADVLNLPSPSAQEAHRALIERAGAALGIATEGELRDYFRLAAR